MKLQFEGPLIGQCQIDLFVSWVFVFSPSDPSITLIYTLRNILPCIFYLRLKESLKLVILL